MTRRKYLPLFAITCVPLLIYSMGVTQSSPSQAPKNVHQAVSREKSPLSLTTPKSSSRTDGELLGDSPGDVELGVPSQLSVEEAYRSAKEAVDAVFAGARSFDNDMLEKFKLPGLDCDWCEEFYSQIRELVFSESIPLEERHYMALLLAQSGRTENIKSLIDGVLSAPSDELKDIFTEALELVVANDEVVRFLGAELENAPEGVRESIATAITRQSLPAAAEELDRYARISGEDKEISFNDGIGLEEFAPDEESLPILSEIVKKQDNTSPLAAVALANGGEAGFKELVTTLRSLEYEESSSESGLIDTLLEKMAITDEVMRVAREYEASSEGKVREFLEKILAAPEGRETVGADTEAEQRSSVS